MSVHERIWLQWEGIDADDSERDGSMQDEVTWCQTRQFDTDIEYTLRDPDLWHDRYMKAVTENDELRKKLRQVEQVRDEVMAGNVELNDQIARIRAALPRK